MKSPTSRIQSSALRLRLLGQAPLVLIFGYIVALLYRLTLIPGALYWGDIFLYFLPAQEYAQKSLQHGYIPLWNRFVLCGQPFVGNPQSWIIYPSTALVPFMPAWTYLTVDYVLHLTLAGLGAYLFARRLCGDRICGVLAAVVFAGSGFIMVRLQFPTMVQAAAWFPWLLLLADRLIEKPGVGYASLLALTVALLILAGHPQLAYISFFAASIYFLSRLYQARKHVERMRSALVLGILALAVGVVMTGAQILPTLELFGLSTRERLTWSQANRFVIRPTDLIHFLAPYWHGNPAEGNYWGPGNMWETCVYVGIIPLVLAAYTIIRHVRRRAVAFFSLLCIGSLWLAMGKFGGIFFIAFYVVPGLASFHDPARFTFITTFALSILAALGLRTLRERGWRPLPRAALACAAALNLWAFSANVNPTIDPSTIATAFQYRPRYMSSAPAIGEGRVFTAQRDRVWQRFLNYSDYGPDSARYTHELTDTVSPNIGMRFGVEEGSGYEPVPVRAVTELDALVRSAMDRKSPNLPELLGLFNATSLLLPEMTRFRHPALEDLPARGTTVLEMRDPFFRAWLVRHTVIVEGEKRSLAALTAADFDPRRSAVVSAGKGIGDGFADLPVSPVRIEAVSEGKVVMLADAGSAPAYLVLSETWFPGWTATVDSSPTVVERANHAFRGVAIPPGIHRVEMRYRPAAFRVGLFLTLGSLGLVTAGLTYGGIARQHRHVANSDTASGAVRGKRAVEV